MQTFDVLVVGGGHAGVEAATAAARIGAKVALLTHQIWAIGAMSCNPAFGGLGKGHLVREIDALDGLMGRAADAAAIQFRTLNRSKGPAVQGPRVQADRQVYKREVFQLLGLTANLKILQDECESLVVDCGKIIGAKGSSGEEYRCQAVILATGTFLNGVIHRGKEQVSSGRLGEQAATKLAAQFRILGFEVGRLKTGTPPRLIGPSIEFGELELQWGDDEPQFLSFLSERATMAQAPCYITRTNPSTHRLIEGHLHETAVYSGAISGRGPRYCPSVEDKVVRFRERESHQIFLEPEGLELTTVYPNGLSTSLPCNLQDAVVRSIQGLQKARIKHYGYAIEYDYVNPTQLHPTLMTHRVAGLFLCGQINGTTGYEEAGAQGVVAGINAARFAGGQSGYVFDRADSYIGVMVDDLVTRGVAEPYRMFTSRAEYRLRLRADNADERLTSIGVELGVVGEDRAISFRAKTREISRAMSVLLTAAATANDLRRVGVEVADGTGRKRSAFEWATRSGVCLPELSRLWPEIDLIKPSILDRLNADAKYSVYLERQQADIERHRADENLLIPLDLDFLSIEGLSNEMKQKFQSVKPESIAQAGRIDGATPSALMLLAVHARKNPMRVR